MLACILGDEQQVVPSWAEYMIWGVLPPGACTSASQTTPHATDARSDCCHAPDLFAIVKTTEKLERAYVRDAISAKDYEPLCEKLIAQFRTLWETLRDTVQPRCRSKLALISIL